MTISRTHDAKPIGDAQRMLPDAVVRERLAQAKAWTGWFFLLVLLAGFFPPGARGQKIIVTANASATGSATVDEYSLGSYQDNVTISAQGWIVMEPIANQQGAWTITSSNYNVSVSGSGNDDANGQMWTETEANPDEGFSLYLDFDSTLNNIPFVGGQAQFEITAPWVNISPSTVTDDQDGLNQALFAWGEFGTDGLIDVSTNDQPFTVSGSGSEEAIPIVGVGLSETGSFNVSFTVSFQPAATNLTIISVQTPATVNGSQNTFISTDTITLMASVGSGKAGVPVGWSVVGLNAASPAVVATGVVNTGAGGIATFSFSPSQNSAFVQFRKANFATTGSRQPNPPLSFDVVVSAVGQQAKLSQSGLGTLMQDNIDTLRQEYVDYQTMKGHASYTPQRSDVVPSLGGAYNGGNYGVQLAFHLDTSFQAILQAYQSSTITVNGVSMPMPANAQITLKSGYRNPQRNKAVKSVFPQTSHHMFGGALDLAPDDTWVKINGKRVWVDPDQILFPALEQAASTQGTAIAEIGAATKVPVGTPGEDHIHVEW